MPSEIRLTLFKRRFERYGIEITPTGSGHYKMRGNIDGTAVVYIFPTISGRRVKYRYLERARKSFKLTPEFGVSDEEFNRR